MRQAILDGLRNGTTFDLLVIGGGATGLGIAVDAATRGLAVALVERNDFAEGTSSRSTKLVHGGVRYLEAAVRHLDRAQYKLVREALHERGILLRNAPHLTNRLPLVTPLYSWAEVPYVFAGLKLYDLLSGRMSLGASRLLSRAEALRRFPMLRAEGLKAGVLYYDGQFVDTRLAATLAMTAAENGALVANHVAAVALLHDESGRVGGARVRDSLAGDEWEIAARVTINAAGPFSDAVRRLDDPAAKPILKVSSGVHILLDSRFVPPDTGLLIPRTDDGRVLFALPWQGHAIVGTTDEAAAVTDHPEASEADIAYLLDYVRRYFDLDAGRGDVRAAWCGLRPLVFDPKAGNTAALARDHVIIDDPSGLITIAGGKWTTYRLMAEQAVDHALATGRLPLAAPCRTREMRLAGGGRFVPGGEGRLAAEFGLDADVAAHLHHAFGDRAGSVARLAAAENLGARLAPGLPYIEAEVVHAVRAEAAERVADVLCRRLTLALVDAGAAAAALPRAADLMARERGWDRARRDAEAELARRRLAEAI